MDLLKKLEDCKKRFDELSARVMDGDLVKDVEKYKDVMREHGHLSELMELYGEYKKMLAGIESDTELITNEDDHDLKEISTKTTKTKAARRAMTSCCCSSAPRRRPSCRCSATCSWKTWCA